MVPGAARQGWRLSLPGSEERRFKVHLKKLELVGFKSFADRTSLDFKPGVTGIVGVGFAVTLQWPAAKPLTV